MSSDPLTSPHLDERPLPHKDLAFVRAALDGNGQAIDILAERARMIPRVLKALNRRWGARLTEQDIEDLSQDVVVYVLQKLGAYRGLSSFDAWLYRFCSLQMRNRLRREILRRHSDIDEAIHVALLDSEGDVTAQLDGRMMWSYVEDLDPMDRQIIHAKHGLDLSFTEIGTRLGTAASSVKTRYYRSLDRLRQRVRFDSRREDSR